MGVKIPTYIRVETWVRKLGADDRFVIAILIAAALIVQIGVALTGFFSVSADESARSLLSDNLTLQTAVDPFIWPPLPKIVFGLGLHIYDNLFLTPRIIAQVFGLAMLGALAHLADQLFRRRAVTIVTVGLSVFLSHRVIFAVAPMSEVFYNPLMVMAFASFVQVCQSYRRKNILLTGLFLALAAMARYEAWFISVAFGLFLMWHCFYYRTISFYTLFLTGVVVSAFPLFWLVDALLSDGGLGALFVTIEQAEAKGATWITMLRNSHIAAFLIDWLRTPMVLAMIPLATMLVNRHSLRIWIIAVIVSLALVTIVTFVAGSVAYAAPWRLGGVWTLIMLPFFSYWIVSLSDKAIAPIRGLVLACATLIGMITVALPTADLVLSNKYRPSFSRADLDVGRFAGNWLVDHSGSVLVEAESYAFLNVLVASNEPERMVLNTGDDVQLVSMYIGRADYWRDTDPVIYDTYVAPKYRLAIGGDAKRLEARNIGLILVQSRDYTEAIIARGVYVEIARFGKWRALTIGSD